jgi:molybdopterin synthase sulfur carrier subunit
MWFIRALTTFAKKTRRRRANYSTFSLRMGSLGQDDLMKALFFAQVRQTAGCEDYLLEIDKPLTQSEFWAALIDAFPGLAAHQKTARLARRETYLQKGEWLQPTDEIAVIPPVSGG